MYLNCHSYYSLRYGTISPKELIRIFSNFDVPVIAFTDVNSSSATLDFVRMAQKTHVRPVVGIDFRNGAQQKFVGIAKNEEGFFELNRFLSEHLHEQKEFPDRAPEFEHVFIIYPFKTYQGFDLRKFEFIGVNSNDLSKLPFSDFIDQKEKLVALQTVTFRNKRDFNTHRLLRAIENNCLLSKLPKSEEASQGDLFVPPAEMLKLYRAFPFLLENAQKLLFHCQFRFQFGSEQEHQNQHHYTDSEEEDFKLIHNLCMKGLLERYPQITESLLSRVEKEINIIAKKGFLAYFLISWDIVNYARSKGYYYVGRGSGANSIVAYLLRITDVDPVDLNLYFERFINLYRKSPPDFDIDFSWKDREDVTEYIFKRFKHATLLAVYNTFQYRATVRELGKVFGLPKREIDLLSNGRFNPSEIDHLSQLVIRFSQLIQGFPNYLGVHAGGIVISEKPIHYHTATFLPPKGYPTTMFDMIIAEDAGLHKYDILSQRGLGKIKDCVEIVENQTGKALPIDIHDIKALKKDPQIQKTLLNANAIGCFYVESPAMRMLLTKLQVRNYLGLVAASSVIRPGVARSGMMREFIIRYRMPDKRPPEDDIMMQIVPETYGVMVYQEDVIKVAHHFAGLDLSEADVLRRGMSGKFRSRGEFTEVKDRFFSNCIKKGHPQERIDKVWMQIESFAGYAFAKGHSASYAVESYQSLYLKAYYPREYMVATINNGGGFYSSELYLNEARLHGALIEAPCVNTSGALSRIIGKTIFLGMHRIQSLESNAIRQILEARETGLFTDLQDFITRAALGIEQTLLLIRIGAFRFTKKNKKELLWSAYMLLGKEPPKSLTKLLFPPEKKEFKLPPLHSEEHEDAFDQMELLGFPLCNPFDLLKNQKFKHIKASELQKHQGRKVIVTGYLTTTKSTRSKNGKMMYFGTFIDVEGQFLDTVHFPPVVERYPFRGKGIYQITGKVISEFDALSIEVESIYMLPIIEDPRFRELSLYERQRLTKSKRKMAGL